MQLPPPERATASRATAPSMPISSSVVRTTSSRGWGIVLIVQDRQGHGHRNAVIAAQGGALRPDAAVLHQQVQALSGHVLGAAGLFFTHHIQVALRE